MKDFRIEVKIRNNRIFSRIMKRWGSIPLFARCTGLVYGTVVKYIAFQMNPILSSERAIARYLRRGSIEKLGLPWRGTAIKLADTLGCGVFDLWPDEYFRAARNNKYFFEVDKEDMLDLPFEDRKLLMEGKPALEKFNTENIEDVLSTISDRERRVLELRFGLNEKKVCTLQEVGAFEGVSQQRIRQIEARALRKLRHPSRARCLLAESKG